MKTMGGVRMVKIRSVIGYGELGELLGGPGRRSLEREAAPWSEKDTSLLAKSWSSRSRGTFSLGGVGLP
jgi:hypothetical protein